MPFELTEDLMRGLLPKASKAIISAFVDRQDVLARAGILNNRPRWLFAISNVEHECGGFTIPNLTENIKYTAERMAKVWPSRFSGAAAVRAKYGNGPGWQIKAFDDIYGNRMGNRPGTHDGSTYIGHGGPQITGRDGHREVGTRAKLPLEANPDLACLPEHQPAILAAYVSWKGLNKFADRGDFVGGVKVWNGGTNGLADRLAMMKGNDPFIARMALVDTKLAALGEQPGAPEQAVPISIDKKPGQTGTVHVDGLNVRAGASVKSRILRSLNKGAKVSIVDAAMNGSTKWLAIAAGEWVSARYVEI